jgi:hypothetical protein
MLVPRLRLGTQVREALPRALPIRETPLDSIGGYCEMSRLILILMLALAALVVAPRGAPACPS